MTKEQGETARLVEEINLLYVAVTRTKGEWFVRRAVLPGRGGLRSGEARLRGTVA